MSTPVVTDPLLALCSFLQATVGELLTIVPPGIGLRDGLPAVFRPKLPEQFDQVMPAACIVLRGAGGYSRFGKGQMPLGDPRVDVTCYGASDMESDRLARASIFALKGLVMQTWENVRLDSAEISGGPIPLPDPHTVWPATWFSVQLLHSEIPTG